MPPQVQAPPNRIAQKPALGCWSPCSAWTPREKCGHRGCAPRAGHSGCPTPLLVHSPAPPRDASPCSRTRAAPRRARRGISTLHGFGFEWRENKLRMARHRHSLLETARRGGCHCPPSELHTGQARPWQRGSRKAEKGAPKRRSPRSHPDI